jgi:opacity protein-like surface antigen
MKKFCSIVLVIIFLQSIVVGQEDDETLIDKTVPIATLYSNFHTQINGNNIGFEVERAYLGFKTQLNEQYAIIMKLDIGSPDDVSDSSNIKRYAYFKNAAMVLTSGTFTFHAGLIDTYQFKVQEKFWTRRYMYRSFQDEYRFTPSADIGIGLQYDPNEWLSADISFMNGEGYTKLQLDNSFKSGAGLTFKPIKTLIFRIYYDFISKDNVLQSTMTSFGGFQIDHFNVGAEFNYRTNDSNEQDRDRWGYSFYSLYRFAKKWELFARYDYLTSKTLEGEDYGWNYSTDGSALLAGLQFQPETFIKVAISYRDWVPYPSNLAASRFIFLNLEVKI